MNEFLSGFVLLMHWHYIGYMFVGVFFGLVLGFLPGLHGGVGIALLLPLTYGMPPLSALVLLLSIYTGSLFGGAVTSILFNTPGTAANLSTTFDGYPMTLRGEAGRAMGLALMGSFAGGIVGCVCLLAAAKPMAAIALRFGPGEMFMVALFGLSVIGGLSNDVVKSLFCGAFGLLLGTVGTSASGVMRGTFGSVYLFDGIPLTASMIGLMALPEIYFQIARIVKFERITLRDDTVLQLFKGMLEAFRYPFHLLFCSLLGVVVGIMPAAGAQIATMLSYNQAKQFSRHRDLYGTGYAPGIIAAETADNASEGGALTTMFVLGIPGGGATALILGALVLQGWTPGPRLFAEQSQIIYASISSLFLQQFVMLILGVVLCLMATQIIRLPFVYLMPCIVVFTVLGAYSGRYQFFDSYTLVAFAFIGWLMKKNEYPVVSLVLGIILGPIADVELMRVYQAFDSFWEIFLSPIVQVLVVICMVVVAYPVVFGRLRR